MLDKLKEYQAVIFMALLFIAGWLGHGLYSDAVTKAIEETRKLAAESAAQEIARIEIKNTTVTGKVIERVRTETVYAECRHSPDTFGLIKDAYK